MQKFLPIAIGLITIAMFGGLGSLFLSEGRTLWAGLFLGLTLVRTLAWFRQVYFFIRPDDVEAEFGSTDP